MSNGAEGFRDVKGGQSRRAWEEEKGGGRATGSGRLVEGSGAS